MQLCLQVGLMKQKLAKSSISLMGSIWFRRNLFITKSVLFCKVVQNVYVSWIFLGGLSLSQNNKVGGYPVVVVWGL